MSLPTIEGTGNLCADPEFKTTSHGTAYTKLRVACSRAKKDDAGRWETVETTFLDVKLWGKDAEDAVEQYRKGTRVSFSGALRQSSWEDREGNKRTGYEVAFCTVKPAADFVPSLADAPTPF